MMCAGSGPAEVQRLSAERAELRSGNMQLKQRLADAEAQLAAAKVRARAAQTLVATRRAV